MNRYEEVRSAVLRKAAEYLHKQSWLEVVAARHYREMWLGLRGGTNTSNLLRETEAKYVATWEAYSHAEAALRQMASTSESSQTRRRV